MSLAVRGLIEGFYDRTWTPEERGRVAAFIAAHGFDTYAYAPKSDRLQNSDWRTPYPTEERRHLADFAALCHSLGMACWIGLRPLRIAYTDPADAALLVDKLRAHLELGADRLVLLADDIPFELDEGSAGRFGTLADAHAWLVNTALDRLSLPPERLVFVPTEYHGPGSDYVATLGGALPPAVDICWTGPKICSPTITSGEADGIARLLRRPPLVWDNYPVNDAGMVGELHIGPIRGRDADLAERVRGFLVNPALQPEATLIPLATWGEYLGNPHQYDPDAAWRRALLAVAGEAADDVAILAAACDRSVIEQGWEAPSTVALRAARAGLRVMSNRRLAADLAPFL